MKQVFFLLFLLSCLNVFSQRNSFIVFNEKQVDSIDKKIDSILLVGVGSTTTRIFLEDLSESILKGLKDENIVADYRYLGKSTAEAQSGLDTINKKGYKAILFFLPRGEASFDVQGDMNRISSNTSIGPITTTTPTSRIEYQQDFSFQLFIPEANMERIWTASVGVSGDLSKSKNAKKIADKLLYSFKNNKYIR